MVTFEANVAPCREAYPTTVDERAAAVQGLPRRPTDLKQLMRPTAASVMQGLVAESVVIVMPLGEVLVTTRRGA